MTTTLDEVARAAEQLTPQERDALIDRLLDMQRATVDPEVEAAWRDEVDRRLAAIDRGEEELVPWEEVRRDLGLR